MGEREVFLPRAPVRSQGSSLPALHWAAWPSHSAHAADLELDSAPVLVTTALSVLQGTLGAIPYLDPADSLLCLHHPDVLGGVPLGQQLR